MIILLLISHHPQSRSTPQRQWEIGFIGESISIQETLPHEVNKHKHKYQRWRKHPLPNANKRLCIKKRRSQKSSHGGALSCYHAFQLQTDEVLAISEDRFRPELSSGSDLNVVRVWQGWLRIRASSELPIPQPSVRRSQRRPKCRFQIGSLSLRERFPPHRYTCQDEGDNNSSSTQHTIRLLTQ